MQVLAARLQQMKEDEAAAAAAKPAEIAGAQYGSLGANPHL